VSIVFITFIGAFFPILLNTISGVQQWMTCCRAPASVWGRVNARSVRGAGRHRAFTGLAVAGRRVGLADRRRDDLWPVRHRLLHLGSLFADWSGMWLITIGVLG
jgi:hypothetical protein